jgi:hypothetical protein
VLAAVFAVAAVAKLADRDGARQAVRAFGVPGRLAGPVAAALPPAELAVAVALLITTTAVAGAIGSVALLALFLAGISRSLAQGRQPDCRCFGQLHSAPIGWKTLARNLALLAVAALAAAAGPGAGVGTWASGMSAVEWATLMVAIVLVVAFVVEGSLLVERWRNRR